MVSEKFMEEVGLHTPGNSAGDDTKAYFKSLVRLPFKVKERAFKKVSKEELIGEVAAAGNMKKVLNWFDVIMVGIGIILGSGIYVTTGRVAAEDSGPAVILAYCVAGLCAMLTGICYAEFAADFPVAGGSYTYMLATFGELTGWFTVGMMVIQYMLANAGVARSLSGYFANLCGQSSDFFMIAGTIDIIACVAVLAFTGLLVFGTKESATFNNITNILAVSVVIFVIIAGLTKANPANMVPFTGEFGWRGIFNGATIVFFSYIGFDAICNTAEEVKDPARDLPMGIIGSLGVVTSLYVLASLAIVMMVPYTMIDPGAAFSEAFRAVGMTWASYIVAAGACLAICTGVLVGVMTVPRLVVAAAREGLIPPFFGKIHPKFGTPWVATIVTGSITAAIALFTSMDILLDLTSICVLGVYCLICIGVLWRRYYVTGENTPRETGMLSILMATMFTASVLMGVAFVYTTSALWLGLAFGLWVISTAALHILVKPKYVAATFSVPIMPWIASFGMMANIFLLCTIPASQFLVFAIFLGILLVVYLLYGVHAAGIVQAKHASIEAGVGGGDEEEEIELVKGEVKPDTSET